MMTLKEVKSVGGMLTSFLFLFGMCFERQKGVKNEWHCGLRRKELRS